MEFLNIKLQKLINEKKQYFVNIIQLYYSKLIDKYYLFFRTNNNSNTLLIKPENENVKSYYKNHSSYNEGDSGLDLFVPEDTEVKCFETDANGAPPRPRRHSRSALPAKNLASSSNHDSRAQ